MNRAYFTGTPRSGLSTDPEKDRAESASRNVVK